MQDQNSNPFNSRFLIAMVVFALFYFGWNYHLQKKYPGYGKKSEVQTLGSAGDTVPSNSPIVETAHGSSSTMNSSGSSVDAQSVTKQEEKVFFYENEKIAFKISSRGLGLKDIEIRNYKDEKGETIKIGQSTSINLFELKMSDGSDIYFDIQEVGKGRFKGIYANGSVRIERDMEFFENNNSFKSTVKMASLTDKNVPNVKFFIPEHVQEKPNSSWLFPSYHHQDFYVAHENTTTTINFSSAKEDATHEIKGVNLLSIGSQYFVTAIIDQSDTIPEAKVYNSVSGKTATGELSYRVNEGRKEVDINQTLFLGPKSIDLMASVHPELAQVINFGWLSFIAKPLLYTMKWFFSQVPNWGVAIILLTLLVRLFVLPFNLMSYKSMKAMQKIQPLMTAVREKYKDDPVRMNQEVMNLMKENKANPFGGCLPMLLQIPIFFALYRVIGSSIELYGSPFMFWIHDLSAHDKFFVLPILMGVTMFLQQKLTPTNMDPMQAKILMYMPLIFTVFMINLPSGLTLYMFVSALFGVIQQYFMMKTKPA